MSKPGDTGSAPRRVVVVAVDESEYAKEAFKFYVSNLRQEGDKVYLVYAVEINAMLHSQGWYNTPYSFDRDMLQKLLDDEKEKIKHKLEKFAQLLRSAGVDGTVKSMHADSPGTGICKAADEVGASLIVVGSRGMGKIRRTLVGSVSDYVIHHAHVPVLVCRQESKPK